MGAKPPVEFASPGKKVVLKLVPSCFLPPYLINKVGLCLSMGSSRALYLVHTSFFSLSPWSLDSQGLHPKPPLSVLLYIYFRLPRSSSLCYDIQHRFLLWRPRHPPLCRGLWPGPLRSGTSPTHLHLGAFVGSRPNSLAMCCCSAGSSSRAGPKPESVGSERLPTSKSL